MQNSKRSILDLELIGSTLLNNQYVLMKFTAAVKLPLMLPGQFVQVRIDGSPTTYLRRPISVNFVDYMRNELWLLVQMIGDGTRTLGSLPAGAIVNMLLPLGNSFSEAATGERVLLVGGGVGVAPMLMLGKHLKDKGIAVKFLLGARSAGGLLEMEEFKKYGEVYYTTEDGSAGEKGFVTEHSVLTDFVFDRVYTCGPKPMMQAVAKWARSRNVSCEVSLENTMACGIGACLCCVEDTVDGHVCTCTTGPVFNINQLKW